jgi:hypothetical protein
MGGLFHHLVTLLPMIIQASIYSFLISAFFYVAAACGLALVIKLFWRAGLQNQRIQRT